MTKKGQSNVKKKYIFLKNKFIDKKQEDISIILTTIFFKNMINLSLIQYLHLGNFVLTSMRL